MRMLPLHCLGQIVVPSKKLKNITRFNISDLKHIINELQRMTEKQVGHIEQHDF